MWFQSYLSERSQVFRANGKDSKTIRVNCSVPQGSVLGPVEFISYTGDVTDIFERHHIGHHLFADDKQCYKSVAPSEVDLARDCLRACVADVRQWCQSRRLQLNSSKSEIIWLGTRHTLQKITPSNLTLEIGDEVVQPASVVRDLGVLIDQELTLKQHVAKIASSCFYQLRRLKQVRRYVDNDVMAQLVAAFVTSRLVYCNGVLAGLPQSTIAPIQHVQNVAARLVLGLRPFNHTTPALRQLHWLPVVYRVQYKLSVLMYDIANNEAPSYLRELVHHVNETRSNLRSCNSNTFIKPRTRTKLAERAFSFAGPAVWNALPVELRSLESKDTFKRHLKTHHFKLAFYH